MSEYERRKKRDPDDIEMPEDKPQAPPIREVDLPEPDYAELDTEAAPRRKHED